MYSDRRHYRSARQLWQLQSFRYAPEMVLHPDVARLAQTIEAMSVFLWKYNNLGWAEETERCSLIIARSDFYGVERFLGLYGGMGSLNDVILRVGGIADRDDNEQFDALRLSAWEQARALARDEGAGHSN